MNWRINRGDLRWGLVAAIVRALFFFHPLVWLSERQLTVTQEIAADELAIAQQRHNPAQLWNVAGIGCQ